MLRFIAKRILTMLLTLLVIMTLTFLIMHAIPGGPYSAGKRLPEEIQAALDEKYKLNDPLYVQFFDYMNGVLHFDLGPSFKYEGMSVNDLIAQGFPTSATLGLLSMLFTLALSIPLGVLAALKRGKWQDTFVSIITTFGVTIPSFVVATLLEYFLAFKARLFPIYGVADWKGYILPMIALSGYSLAFITRLTRSSLMEVMRSDYIRMARSKGVREGSILFKHGFRNALLTVITVVGQGFISALAGAAVVERLFNIPGMGSLMVDSIEKRDYQVIQAITLLVAMLNVVINLIIDLIYGMADPRIRLAD